jgi:carboxyl-terminal processing protease
MDNKLIRGGLIGAVAVIILLGSFSGGFLVGHFVPIGDGANPFLPLAASEEPPVVPTVSPEQQSATPDELDTLFQPFWEAWNIVHDEYVDQPVDNTVLMQGAIRGMMESLGDEHSSYMDPKTFEDANSGLAGEYEGIGAWVDTTADYLTIISPIPGSPAESVGLKPGDRIIAINGVDMTGIDTELVRQKVLGPAGSTVILTIARESESEPLDFSITRDKIVVQSATGEMLDDGIGYVQITTFGDKTTPELRAALKDLMAQNPKGLIIDLRNNGGGYLQTSVEVASEFIGDGVILYEQYGDGERTTYQALGNGQATEIPLVVLINEGTASASEIVAGAIQDYGRGKLVGVTSFGKGSVQNWVPLSNDQGAVRVTIAKWLTPNERTIHGEGLEPDVVVEITDEDFEADRDPQLDKAIEVLLEELDGSASQNLFSAYSWAMPLTERIAR